MDKHYQRADIGRETLNTIIKQAHENKEITARFLFLDAIPETISWYLSNPLFEILYTALSERIENYCEKGIIKKLNERLSKGHGIECRIDEDADLNFLKKNCQDILTAHVDKIFEEFAPENPLLRACRSKIKLIFENNRPKIKLVNFKPHIQEVMIYPSNFYNPCPY